ILTRARGLGILTFDKIKKKAFWCKTNRNEVEILKIPIILSNLNMPQKNDVKNFFMGLQFYSEQDSLQPVLILKSFRQKQVKNMGKHHITKQCCVYVYLKRLMAPTLYHVDAIFSILEK
ncbi:MAG: hypothetical protein LUD00_10990, partial [Prevotellaceae bacterium]|nr:hypothetical protein [Prevotellaceae bacterium]